MTARASSSNFERSPAATQNFFEVGEVASSRRLRSGCADLGARGAAPFNFDEV